MVFNPTRTNLKTKNQMGNFTQNRSVRQLATIIGTIGIVVASLMMCQKSEAQVRTTVAAGVIGKPMIVGQANIAYDAKKFFGSVDIVRQAVKSGTWFGIKSGYIAAITDESAIRIYSGIQYKVVGRKHSMDRYVHDGQTENLYSGLETNSVYFPIGIQYTKNHLFIDAGAMAGRDISFMVTVGITHLFSK